MAGGAFATVASIPDAPSLSYDEELSLSVSCASHLLLQCQLGRRWVARVREWLEALKDLQNLEIEEAEQVEALIAKSPGVERVRERVRPFPC